MPDPATLTLLFIRHAEKPIKNGPNGVDIDGNSDPESLIPQGWSRAGAWVQLFVPALGGTSLVPTPTEIFASEPGNGSKSERPLETVTPLATMLGLTVDQSFGLGQEPALAAAIGKMTGVVLVCWQHERIDAIVAALTNPPTVPSWPKTCFNGMFRLDQTGSGWSYTPLMPVLLPGDSSTPF